MERISPHQWSLDTTANLENEDFLSTLIEKYEIFIQVLLEENEEYKKKFQELKAEIHDLISENRRLTSELKTTVKTLLEQEELDENSAAKHDGEINHSLKQQLISTTEEKDSLLEMWQHALREIERLEQQLQEEQSRPQITVTLLQQQIIEIKRQYNKIIENLNLYLNRIKEESVKNDSDIKSKVHQISELYFLLETTKEHLLAKERDNINLQLKEKGLKSQIQNFQEVIFASKQKIAEKEREMTEFREKNIFLEKQMKKLTEENILKDEQIHDAKARVKESIQIAEDSLLEKDQTLLKMKHANEEIERLQKALRLLLREAGEETSKEIDHVKSGFQQQILQQEKEIKILQQTNAELKGEIRSLKMDMKFSESESFHYPPENDLQLAYYELQKQLAISENRNGETLRSLEKYKIRLKLDEERYKDENKQWEIDCRQLKDRIKNLEEECESITLRNITLTEQAERYQVEIQELRRNFEMLKKKFESKMAFLTRDKAILEKTYQSKLDNSNTIHLHMCNKLKEQLITQEKLNIRLKLEIKKINRTWNSKIATLHEEISRYKNRTVELSNLLNSSRIKLNIKN